MKTAPLFRVLFDCVRCSICPLPLKTLILLGFLMFSYGNVLHAVGFILSLNIWIENVNLLYSIKRFFELLNCNRT